MKTNSLSVAVGLLCLCTVATSAFADPVAPTLKGDLVALDGKRVKRFDDTALANVKYFGIYFSASWCGPCRQFTPDLIRWYQQTKPKHPEFELIFVSSDQDENSMEAYMAGDKMPWPALKYNKIRTNKSLKSHAGNGIPCLVLLDANGTVLSHSYVNGQYVGPRRVMADITKTLEAGGGAAPDGSSAPAPVPEAPGEKSPAAPRGSTFDDFFKKKNP
jgi:nucleoredoxin